MDPRSVVESTIFVLSILTLIIQVLGWLWVRRLHRSLMGGTGSELVGIISYLLVWMVALRLVGMLVWVGFALVDKQGAYDLAIGVTVVSQSVFIVVVFVVWRRLRRFMKD